MLDVWNQVTSVDLLRQNHLPQRRDFLRLGVEPVAQGFHILDRAINQGRLRAYRLQEVVYPRCVVVYPQGTWYTFVDNSDIDEIIESDLVGGKVVERLKI